MANHTDLIEIVDTDVRRSQNRNPSSGYGAVISNVLPTKNHSLQLGMRLTFDPSIYGNDYFARRWFQIYKGDTLINNTLWTLPLSNHEGMTNVRFQYTWRRAIRAGIGTYGQGFYRFQALFEVNTAGSSWPTADGTSQFAVSEPCFFYLEFN